MGNQSAQWMRTARVLRRTGFGVVGAQVDAVPDAVAYVAAALRADPEDDPGARDTPVPMFTAPMPVGQGAAAAQRKHQAALTEQLDALTGWWLRRMVAVRNPLREKLTMVWHNHFATAATKVRVAGELAGQNHTLRTLGTGDFGALAYAMLTDPAMMRWLDAQTSTAGAPNENLSREFMELFALGHGNGYTETDVREGARALTGWVIRDGAAAFEPKRHDAGPKTVLGVSGSLGLREFCAAVLARPESAAYVATRTWRQLASDQPPSPAALGRLTAAYGPGRDLSALVTAIVADDEFASASGTFVHGPVEWLVGAVRAFQVPVTADADVHAVRTTLRRLGQLPFYPPNVGGWPSGPAWLSTAAAQIRLTAAATLLKKGNLAPISDAVPGDRLDAAAHLLGVGQWSDRSAAVLRAETGNPARLAALAVNTPEYLTS